MKLLFVVGASPFSSDYSGAASRYKQNFLQLHKLFNKVYVLRLGKSDDIEKAIKYESKNSDAQDTKELAFSWQDVVLALPETPSKISRFYRSLFSPIDYEFPYARQITFYIENHIKKVQPNLIWIEHTEPAAGMALLSTTSPWVFSHHDLLHRVRQIRQKTNRIRDRWDLSVCRRAEMKVICSAPTILTASNTEAERISAMGGKNICVIPVSYEKISSPSMSARLQKPIRIVHFGGLETTANRIGLEAYLRTEHDCVVAACRHQGVEVSLWIVGDAAKAREPLTTLLKKANATLTGFVPHLETIFRPFDIAILPYEHDTGYRTKLPLLFGFAQVVVSTRAAIAGTQISGLDDVCIICERLGDFADAISTTVSQPTRMENLGLMAHKFFLENFTSESFQQDYQRLISSIVYVADTGKSEI